MISGHPADMYEDYRKVLDRKDIEVVIVTTPDHWHTKIAIEAMQAGKDVYCEKPLTLTIDEGKKICKVQKETESRVSSRHAAAQRIHSPYSSDRQLAGQNSINSSCRPWRWCMPGSWEKSRKSRAPSAKCDPCDALPEGRCAGRTELGHVAGQTPLVDYVQGGRSPSNPQVSRQPHALRIPLVV